MTSSLLFRLNNSLSALLLAGSLAGCSVSDQISETATPSAVPNTVRTDADRRAIYNSNGTPSQGGYAVPDATPNRVRLGEQAAEINREKRIENVNTNNPNTTPTETRLNRLDYGTPVPLNTTGRP
ncbi:MAG: hypothetical protein M3Y12_09155 [Bacteroidota bacterium]|nr:hypothetical protein [Bacteroidota bacterium]